MISIQPLCLLLHDVFGKKNKIIIIIVFHNIYGRFVVTDLNYQCFMHFIIFFFLPCILSCSECDVFFFFSPSQMISVYFCTVFFFFFFYLFLMFIHMLPLSVCKVHCIIRCVCCTCVYGAWVYLFAAGFGVYGVLDISLPINVYFSLNGGGILWTISL